MRGSNNRHFCLIVLETGESKIKSPADFLSPEGLLPVDDNLLAMPSHGTRGVRAAWDLFLRALIPFMSTSPSISNHLPKASLPNIITLEMRFSAHELGTREA